MQIKIGETVIVCGSLPRDAKLQYVGDKQTPLCKFGLKVGERPAADGSGQREAVWCNCTCWRKVAEAASKARKGDVALAVGRIQESVYTNREGEEVTGRELVCEGVFLMNNRSEENKPAVYAHTVTDVGEVVADDDLPF